MPPAGGIFMPGRQADEIRARVAVARTVVHVDGDRGALNPPRAGGRRRRC